MAAAAWVSKPDLLLGPQPSWFTFQGMRKPPSLVTRRSAPLTHSVSPFPVPVPSALGNRSHKQTQKPRNDKFVFNCIYLVVPPEPGKSVWVNDPEDFGFLIFPLDVRFIAAIREELVHVVPQQPAV